MRVRFPELGWRRPRAHRPSCDPPSKSDIGERHVGARPPDPVEEVDVVTRVLRSQECFGPTEYLAVREGPDPKLRLDLVGEEMGCFKVRAVAIAAMIE